MDEGLRKQLRTAANRAIAGEDQYVAELAEILRKEPFTDENRAEERREFEIHATGEDFDRLFARAKELAKF